MLAFLLYLFITCAMQVMVLFCHFLLSTLRKNFQSDLHDIFRKGWQWADEQVIKFSPDGGTGKTCLGGGFHCLNASSFICFV